MAKRTLDDLQQSELRGRAVLMRVDFNVPLDESGGVADDTRIRRSLPTLEWLAGAGARTILISHLGRPGGAPDPELSLLPMAHRLGELMDAKVDFVDVPVGDEVARRVDELEDGEVLMVENARFHPGERADDDELARAWARLADVYVQDAFGTAHRAHASVHALPRAVRDAGGTAVAGRLVEEELRSIGRVLDDPERPFVGVLGGAKISGKIEVVQALLGRVDRLLVGGAMANTFFRALGLETGDSLVEEDRTETARSLLEEAGDRLLLPVDCVVADAVEAGTETRVAGRDEVGPEEAIGDVGPRTCDLFREEVLGAGTVVWNGPLGVFELEPFSEGTMAMARAAAEAADAGAVTVIGGGDSAAAAAKAGVADRITHVSTGGGAFLDLLSGASLPGIEVLSDRNG